MASLIDKLFVEVNADLTNFKSGMGEVNKDLARFADFTKGAPVVAAGAFASSLLLVATQARAMALEVDRSVQQATRSMPSLLARTNEIKDAIAELSVASGRSQASIAEAFASAANTGVESFSQLNQVVRTAVRVADATGEDVRSIIGGLDATLDSFGLSAARAGEVGARLFALTQGKLGFTELTKAIQPVVPQLDALGLSFEVVVGAMAELLGRNFSPKDAARELKALGDEGEAGAAKIRDLAGDVASTSEAIAELTRQADAARGASDRAAENLQARFAAILIRLGETILPTTNFLLGKTADLFDRLSGAYTPVFGSIAEDLPDTENALRARLSGINEALEELKRGREEYEAELARVTAPRSLPVQVFDPGGAITNASKAVGIKEEIAAITQEIEILEARAEGAQAKLADLIAAPDIEAEARARREKAREDERKEAEAKRRQAESLRRTRQEVESAARALEELAERAVRAEEALGDPFVAGLSRLTRELEELQTRAAAGGAAALEQAQADASRILDAYLQAAEQSLTEALGKFTEQTSSAARAEVFKAINEQARARAQFKETISSNLDTDFADTLRYVRELVAKDQERVTYLQQQGRAIREAVDGTLDLLNAFGLVDDRTADILGNIAQLGSSLPAFAASLQGNVGIETALQTALPVAGGIAQLLGGLGSLGGPGPELIALREAVERNREALEVNSQRLAETSGRGLGETGLSGEQIATGRSLRNFDLSSDGPIVIDFGGAPNVTNITSELDRLGISMEDLEDLAKELGLEFVELTNGNPQQFLEFLDQVQEKLGGSIFGSGLGGRLEQARVGFGFSADPVSGGQRVQDLVQAAGFGDGFSSLIANAFAGIEWDQLETPAVQEQMRSILRDLFAQVTSADFDDFEGLGDFTSSEFIGFLVELLGLIPPVVEDAADEVESATDRMNAAFGRLGRAFRVFDFSTLEQAEQFLATLGEFSPALQEIISQFDLSTVEGMDAAVAMLQAFYQAVEDGEISLEGTGITVDLLVDAIDRLQGASTEAAREIERLAAEEAKRAEQAEQEAERQAQEAEREAQRAQDAARRAAEQAERDRVATGDRALRQLSDEFRLFGITSPQEQLQQRFNVLNQGSNGLFGQVTGGADLSDPTGQAAALEALKKFFLDNPQGVDAGFFGADAVRGQVLELAELIKSAQELAISESGGIEAVGVDRTISEVTGDRMAGLLGSQLVVEQDQLAELRLIRALLTPGSVGTLAPPSLALATASGGGATAGGTTIVSFSGDININATGAVATDGTLDIPALTELIAAEIVRQVAIQKAGG